MTNTTEARRLADALAADVASLLREGMPQEAMRADKAHAAMRALADERDILRAEVSVLQMACSRWERALEHGAGRIRKAEAEADSLRAQVEALRADAERYQFMRHPYISHGQHKQIIYAVDELSEHMMDEAIDAARLREGKG